MTSGHPGHPGHPHSDGNLAQHKQLEQCKKGHMGYTRDDLNATIIQKALCIRYKLWGICSESNHPKISMVPMCPLACYVWCLSFRSRRWRPKRASRGPNFGFWPSAGSWLFVLAWFGGPKESPKELAQDFSEIVFGSSSFPEETTSAQYK